MLRLNRRWRESSALHTREIACKRSRADAQVRISGAMKSVQCGNTWSRRDQCRCGNSDSMRPKSPEGGANSGRQHGPTVWAAEEANKFTVGDNLVAGCRQMQPIPQVLSKVAVSSSCSIDQRPGVQYWQCTLVRHVFDSLGKLSSALGISVGAARRVTTRKVRGTHGSIDRWRGDQEELRPGRVIWRTRRPQQFDDFVQIRLELGDGQLRRWLEVHQHTFRARPRVRLAGSKGWGGGKEGQLTACGLGGNAASLAPNHTQNRAISGSRSSRRGRNWFTSNVDQSDNPDDKSATRLGNVTHLTQDIEPPFSCSAASRRCGQSDGLHLLIRRTRTVVTCRTSQPYWSTKRRRKASHADGLTREAAVQHIPGSFLSSPSDALCSES